MGAVASGSSPTRRVRRGTRRKASPDVAGSRPGAINRAALQGTGIAPRPAHLGPSAADVRLEDLDQGLIRGRPIIELDIPKSPLPKARPRVTKRGGRYHAYTPPKTATLEERIRTFVKAKLGEARAPLLGPLSLVIIVYRPVPATVPKRDYATALPSQRPDLDNYIKLIVDALTARKSAWGLWKDDAQLVDISARKRYAIGRAPGWHIVVARPLYAHH